MNWFAHWVMAACVGFAFLAGVDQEHRENCDVKEEVEEETKTTFQKVARIFGLAVFLPAVIPFTFGVAMEDSWPKDCEGKDPK